MTRRPRARPIPQGGHDLLLRAALLDGDAARDAFASWRAQTDLDLLDQASYRLVPLLVANLDRIGVSDDWMERLRGMRRRQWLGAQLLLRDAAGVLDVLLDAEIPVIALKGAALTSQAYGGAFVRSMADVDLLVRWDDFPRAVERMQAAGWRGGGRAWRAFARWPEGCRVRYGGVILVPENPTTPEPSLVDLHFGLLNVSRYHSVPFPEDLLFEAAEPFELQGRAALRLTPRHQLMHTCFHGMQAQRVATVRWVADAHHLIRATADRLDWDTFVDELVEHRIIAPVREALDYLATTFATPVPADVRRRLGDLRLSRVERLETPLRLEDEGAWAPWQASDARIQRIVQTDVPVGARARLLGSEINKILFRLPYKHWIRPLFSGGRNERTDPDE